MRIGNRCDRIPANVSVLLALAVVLAQAGAAEPPRTLEEWTREGWTIIGSAPATTRPVTPVGPRRVYDAVPSPGRDPIVVPPPPDDPDSVAWPEKNDLTASGSAADPAAATPTTGRAAPGRRPAGGIDEPSDRASSGSAGLFAPIGTNQSTELTPAPVEDEDRGEVVGVLLAEEHPVLRRRRFRRWVVANASGAVPLKSNLALLKLVGENDFYGAIVRASGKWTIDPAEKRFRVLAVERIQVIEFPDEGSEASATQDLEASGSVAVDGASGTVMLPSVEFAADYAASDPVGLIRAATGSATTPAGERDEGGNEPGVGTGEPAPGDAPADSPGKRPGTVATEASGLDDLLAPAKRPRPR